MWAASAAFTQFVPSDFDDDEDAETALGWLTRDWLRRFTQAFGRWLDVAPSWPPRWRDAAGMNDTFVVVTAAQLQELTAEIDAVVHRYARVGQGDPEAVRVAVCTTFYPVDMDQAPRR